MILNTEKHKFTMDLRDDRAAVTWEIGAPLTLHLSTGEVDLTLVVGPHAIRQLRQMLSWADGHPAVPQGPILDGWAQLPPETYWG
jgi:hypothetical protein